MYDFQTLDGEGYAWGINNAGAVVGSTLVRRHDDPAGIWTATMWDSSSSSQPQTFDGPSNFWRINNAGQAVGMGHYLLTGNTVIDLRELSQMCTTCGI